MTKVKLLSREEFEKITKEKKLPTGMARALRGHRFAPCPESPTLGVLRLDTDAGQHSFLVTRKTLERLSEEMEKCAHQLERLAS